MYNEYYIRCKQSDIQNLYSLALALGVLSKSESGEYFVSEQYEGDWSEVGAISEPTGEFLITQEEKPEFTLVQLTKFETTIWGEQTEVEYTVDSYEPTGNTIVVEVKTPIVEVLKDNQGIPFWHANLKINTNLAEIAREKAQTNPAIAAGLSDLSRWFVVGPDGNASRPNKPNRVWL